MILINLAVPTLTQLFHAISNLNLQTGKQYSKIINLLKATKTYVMLAVSLLPHQTKGVCDSCSYNSLITYKL